MKCPFCGSLDTQVIDSRVSEPGDSIRRRRRCVACQKRFTTYENVELRLPQVVKSNGNRSDFDAAKIERRLHSARCTSGPYPPNSWTPPSSASPSNSWRLASARSLAQIGEMVMKELYKLDKVAYIRFASVYRCFQDVDDFRDAIEEVAKPPQRRRTRR